MSHVYARLAGFRHRIVPVPPYSIARVAGDASIRVATADRKGATSAALIDVSGGALRIQIQGASRLLSDVCDILDGPDDPGWTIETSPWSCAWPEGFEIVSPEDNGPIPFYLVGPGDAAIFVQGPVAPSRFPSAESLVARGQTLRASRATPSGFRVLLDYAVEGRPWSQQLETVLLAQDRLVVVTAQSPAPSPPDLLAAAQRVAESCRPAA